MAEPEQRLDFPVSASLTQRERDILLLLAENLSNREIADRLVLAYTTVKWYNHQIFNKLGVENREQAVQRAIALDLLEPPTPRPSPAHDLPVPLTPFIGRVSELDDLSHLLDHPHTRFLTVLAPGGMGKTRLVLAAAENALGQFEDGVYFVPLASLTSPDQLIPAIAEIIGLQFFPNSRPPKQQLLDFLHAKHMLLILDNFEHLLEGAVLAADILNAAPGVKAFTTSRERLDLAGETVYTLGGLPYPGQSEAENRLDYSAVQLFVQCARRANSHFIAEDEVSIARICQLAQGMPLAIELAAAWIGTLSPAEIADEIMRSTDFLHTTMRNAPERLRSIRAVFEATWRRLTPEDQQAFRRLSVFRGGCTREAAHVVAGAELVTLAGLVDKAILWHRPESRRYEIHELLRQYAAEQLEAAGEAETTKTVHQDYFGKLAHEWGKALKTSKQLRALDVLEADFDNLREGFRRAIEIGKPDGIEPFTDLWYFYEMRARNVEGAQAFGAAIEALKGQDSLALGKLLVGQAIFHERFYQFDQERLFALESLAILQRLGAARETAFSMTALGVALSNLGEMQGAMVIWHEALEIAQRYDDQWAVTILLVCLGGDALLHQHFDEAKKLFSRSAALMGRLGNHWGRGFVLKDLAYLAYQDGDYAEAQRLFEAGLASAQKVRHLTMVCAGLEGLRRVAIAKGELVPAKLYAEDALKIERDLGNGYGIFLQTIGQAEVAIASGSDQEAREWLREALQIFVGLDDPNFFVSFGVVASQFLAQTDAGAPAAVLTSFLVHYPRQDWISEIDRVSLQKRAAQLQSQLPADAYSTAWKKGQTLPLAELLTIVQAVI